MTRLGIPSSNVRVGDVGIGRAWAAVNVKIEV